MAKSANLYARIEPEVKEQAETILSALGIPASNAITMFYSRSSSITACRLRSSCPIIRWMPAA